MDLEQQTFLRLVVVVVVWSRVGKHSKEGGWYVSRLVTDTY